MSTKTPGRNDPCPCGSGKKYKQCCQRHDSAQADRVRAQATEIADALQSAMAQHRAGRLAEAESIYRQILQVQPHHPDALHLSGLIAREAGQHEAALERIGQAIQQRPAEPLFHNSLGNEFLALGRWGEAEASYRQALQLNSNYADALYSLGVALQMQGCMDEAATHYQRVLKVAPGYAEAAYNLGVGLQTQGKLDASIASYRKAIESRPGYVQAMLNLGVVLQLKGEVGAAIAAFRQALSIAPNYAEVYSNLGNALRERGELTEAAASCRKAIELKPGLAEAHNNLGTVLLELGKLDEARSCFDQALQLKQDFAEAYCNLGGVFKEMNQPDEVIRHCMQALAIRADYAEAYNSLGWAFQSQGRLEEARACYRQSMAIKPNNGIRITSALMLPPIMGTREEVRASRASFESNLDQLIADGVKLADPLKEGCETNFYLAFHGVNDKDIQQKIARFYEQACPELLYVAPHCQNQKRGEGKIRIGFLSKFIYRHSVALCFGRVVEELSRHQEFEVVLLSSHDHLEGSARNMYGNFAGRHVHLPNDLAQARQKVAEQELDTLCYLDIGMEPLSYFLAFARLARVQCVLAGHPVTTGIGNLDYYLSAELIEPEGAEEHYSEKLVRLPMGLFYYQRPALPQTFKTRRELGLPDAGHIYSCPMMLQKIHPDFDAAIANILRLDTTGYVVLFEDADRKTWRTLLERRFEKTIPADVRSRVIFMPWIANYADFLSVNAVSDVVLDPFHFGIGTTAIATFSVGTPLITMPGEFQRGRVGQGYCRLVNALECVAPNAEDYVQKAVGIATDPQRREAIKTKILAGNQALFDNQQPIRDMADFLYSLAGAASINRAADVPL